MTGTALRPNEPTLAERAYRIRRNAVRMGEVQGQGYIAQALDIADVLAVAYFHAMRAATASCCRMATTPSRCTRR
jgi:transketolase